MLTHLSISNYALIDKLALDFDAGLSTITGETGAGKSILLGALKLVLGDRADLSAIKEKDKKCVIEATFDLANLNLKSFFEANELEYENITIFRREILPSGKTRAFVNDSPTKISILAALSSQIIDIHSQFETADLLNPAFQFEWLDAVAEQTQEVHTFQALLKQYKAAKATLEKLELEKLNFQKELDYNQFLFEELEQAKVEDHDLEELESEQNLLENAEETAISLSEASQILDADELGVIDLLAQLQVKAKYFATYIQQSDLKDRIDSLLIEANDISSDILLQLDALEPNPDRLREVQNTLNLLHTLMQKHQTNSLDELLQIKSDIADKINQGFEVDNHISRLDKETQRIQKALNETAKKIYQNRKKVIPSIAHQVMKTLKDLGMPNAQLQFNLEEDNDFNAFGKDKIQLLFTANKGMALQSIEKAASGGERSRLMLAIKESVSKHKELPTLILDEIDTGVSGKVAGSIGAVMHRMGEHMQVIAITHLPQVAAYGQTHYKVVKFQSEERTITSVQTLDHAERIQELAEIMSGNEVTNAARNQAEELLKRSKS